MISDEDMFEASQIHFLHCEDIHYLSYLFLYNYSIKKQFVTQLLFAFCRIQEYICKDGIMIISIMQKLIKCHLKEALGRGSFH